MPGWDEWIIETTRKLAHHGFATISPHLYFREGPGSPDDVGARVRAAGGVPTTGGRRRAGRRPICARSRNANGKVGVIGFCSGGRHAFLVRLPVRSSTHWSIAGAATWSSTIPRRSTPSGRSRRSISPQHQMPDPRLFGNDDENPNADQVNRTEAVSEEARQELRIPPLRRRRPRLLQHRATGLSAPSRPPTAGRRCSPSSTSISADGTEKHHVLLHREKGEARRHREGTEQQLDAGRHRQRLLRPSL
jgi:dienelactone hydrolase